MKYKPQPFTPEEIIFSVTDSCNLKCAHCFVERKNSSLDSDKAIKFIESALNSDPEKIWKIGFSGGEPFLNLDFICRISAFCVNKGLLFDRIMTNCRWWKSEDQLSNFLQKLMDSGYDGKFGISFDIFHGADCTSTVQFIQNAFKLWNDPQMFEIQCTFGNKTDSAFSLKNNRNSLEQLAIKLKGFLKIKGNEGFIETEDGLFIKIFLSPQSLNSDSKNAWQDKKWFKDDFCQGPGNVLFVIADGRVAPCCGYANENEKLIIGTIDDSFETIMNNAADNEMVKNCYETGLEKYRNKLKKQGQKFPGKTEDMCLFCDWVCKNS